MVLQVAVCLMLLSCAGVLVRNAVRYGFPDYVGRLIRVPTRGEIPTELTLAIASKPDQLFKNSLAVWKAVLDNLVKLHVNK